MEIDEAMLYHSLLNKGRKPEGLVMSQAPLDMDLQQDEELPIEGLLSEGLRCRVQIVFVPTVLKRALKTVFTLRSVLSRLKSF